MKVVAVDGMHLSQEMQKKLQKGKEFSNLPMKECIERKRKTLKIIYLYINLCIPVIWTQPNIPKGYAFLVVLNLLALLLILKETQEIAPC